MIKNQDSVLKDSTGFSFRDSKLELIGDNFINTIPLKIRISNELKTKIYTNLYTFKSSKLIEFNLPSISDLEISTSLSFPITFKFGISFNDGIEYFEKDLLYLDKYTTLFLFQTSPSIIPRNPQLLSIQGISFEYVDKCQIKLKGNIVFESNVTKISSNIVSCNVTYSSILKSPVNEIEVFVTNIFNDTSNGFKITVYSNPYFFFISFNLTIDDPIPQKFTFSNGLTIGNFNLGIFVNGVTNDVVYCKFGSIECSKPCETINSTFISCYGIFKFFINILSNHSNILSNWYISILYWI